MADCDECPMMEERRQYDIQIGELRGDVKKLEGNHHALNTEVKILQQSLQEHIANSQSWHTQHNRQMENFDNKLSKHMDEESEELALVMAPVIQRLDSFNESIREIKTDVRSLFSRWWAIAGVAVMVLLGIVGYLYVDGQQQLHKAIDQITVNVEDRK